jgi:hypothetical protein
VSFKYPTLNISHQCITTVIVIIIINPISLRKSRPVSCAGFNTSFSVQLASQLSSSSCSVLISLIRLSVFLFLLPKWKIGLFLYLKIGLILIFFSILTTTITTHLNESNNSFKWLFIYSFSYNGGETLIYELSGRASEHNLYRK